MSHYINTFLATELTCIPQVLDRYVGKYYSNTISNGATWLFFIWSALHFVFEESVNSLMKKMRMKEYVRVRLKQSVWYLSFYITSFAYCTATLYKNNIDVFSHRKLLNAESDAVPGYLILGFVVLCTFYVHSIFWEGLQRGFTLSSVSYVFLTAFILTTYFTRKVELSLSLLAVVSFSQFIIEVARCVSTLLKNNSYVNQILMKVVLFVASGLFVLTHLVIVPLFFLIPLGYSFIWDSKTVSLALLNCCLWLWLLVEVANNPLYKFIKHWIYHKPNTPITTCPGLVVECSLFQPRDDVAYNLKIIRQEIREREAKMLSLRKPKNRSMLIQTLKCMVALKRKLKQKRSADNSDSEDSDLSESDSKDRNGKNSDSSSEDEISELEEESTGLVKGNDSKDKNEDSEHIDQDVSNNEDVISKEI